MEKKDHAGRLMDSASGMVSGDQVRELVREFRTGEIDKEAYWQQMLHFHGILQAYRELINARELDRIEITASGLVVVLANGLRFVWDPEEFRTAISHVINEGGYEVKERSVLSCLAKRCVTIFDVGANIGWYALHFGRLVAGNHGVVYAFEPIPDTFSALTVNLELNPTGNIRPFRNAFGEANGTGAFFVSRLSGAVAASMRPLYDSVDWKVECEVRRLDDFVAEGGVEKIDLIKCDVEGSELYVFRGGLETLQAHRPMLFVEMLRKWAARFDYHPNETMELLGELGYRCFFSKNGRLRLLEWMTDDCMETNFYFLHEKAHEHVIGDLAL